MGMNYYIELSTNHCDHCGRGDAAERLHIGKSSYGWCFSLHVMPERGINDFEDWRLFFAIAQGVIRDEDGRVVTTDEMLAHITERRGTRTSPLHGYLLGPRGLLRHTLDGTHCVAHGAGTWDCIAGDFE